ncbi:hypothetical protein [Streptomyces sp. NPDC088746]|uniref:hypothetical protein n=1 Tax=Streptomyces sp. NPDC088746 TaxID=3365885 RepID=UPI003801F65D
MVPVETPCDLSTDTGRLAAQVEALLDPQETEGVFHDSPECNSLLLTAGAVLLSPPTPRPKKG